MIKKILVANRGEIAVRVIRACRDLGIDTVAIYSEADAQSLHVQLADMAVCVGPPPGRKSYLDMHNIIAAALGASADAIHPGYGFLSENAQFARLCETHNIIFIGPSPDTIEMAGDKVNARQIVMAAGVPVVPGSPGKVSDVAEARKIANEIGYPILVKAKGGGGGKGMRVILSEGDLLKSWSEAAGEASAAFGDDGLYIERYMDQIRHVEVQVIADKSGNVIALGDRDCTVQRRHQKLIEEAPCPILSKATREKIFIAAVQAAKAINYFSVGTVEFLYEPATDNFYFIEVNSRIQVEHPVTEVLTNVDLVVEQIKIARGESICIDGRDNGDRGHAIECRINAEDASRDFFPSPGLISRYIVPGGPGIRVDGHCYQGYQFPPQYDSLLAKVIAYGPTREIAVERMIRALSEFVIEGIKTTIPFQLEVLEDEEFRSGIFTTRFLETRRKTSADIA